ncbi:MAG: BON domain-containing protein [Marinicaulis sp.]|nr:BON domain-containing protein [Marinicaulis sp.]NNL87657.1 BON domain-containing protein [Marinicaulis sp.]
MKEDERIRNDIQEEIAWDPRVKTTDIGVTVKNGAVRLTGTVASYAERYAAETAAKRVKGVHAVAEDIEISLPNDDKVTDEVIAERISNLLEWNVIIPDPHIQAEVRNGYVTLTGEVDWNFERDTIKNQVIHMYGVRGVDNRVMLRKKAQKKQVSERDIKYQITRALHRNADLEKSKINIAVDGNKVTLTGDINANYEKALIERAAWSAQGVMQVVDNLRVN